VPNKYPALVPEPGAPTGPGDALRVSAPARGHHEVIVEGPEHRASVVPPTPDVFRDVLAAARLRFASLRRDERLRHFALFKNHGRAGGASLPHPHWQLAAVPIVPPALENELRIAGEYLEQNGAELWDDLLAREIADGARVIEVGDGFAVLAAYAPQWTGEVWIVPRVAGAQIGEVDDETAARFAATLWRTLHRVATVMDEPPLNVVCHTAPLDRRSGEGYRWHARIEPRLGMRAGFELGSGIAIVTLMPEEVAEAYRGA
jgi:UDPglucose--hexose-1-phosphate uridylyltransferase